MGLAHSPSIVNSGLVLCLDAGNPRSYPGTGTLWNDVSGNGKNATLGSSAIYSAPGTMLFDGVDDFVNLVSQADAQTPLSGYGNFTGADTSPFTIELWLKTTQIAGVDPVNTPALVGRNDSDIWANLNLYNGYVYYLHYNSVWEYNLKSTTMVSDNKWHQVVYVNNINETGSIFIDGVSEVTGSSSLSGSNYFSPDRIGLGYSNKYFQGNIGSLKFYDKSLTAAEIQQNFNALRGRYGI